MRTIRTLVADLEWWLCCLLMRPSHKSRKRTSIDAQGYYGDWPSAPWLRT